MILLIYRKNTIMQFQIWLFEALAHAMVMHRTVFQSVIQQIKLIWCTVNVNAHTTLKVLIANSAKISTMIYPGNRL